MAGFILLPLLGRPQIKKDYLDLDFFQINPIYCYKVKYTFVPLNFSIGQEFSLCLLMDNYRKFCVS